MAGGGWRLVYRILFFPLLSRAAHCVLFVLKRKRNALTGVMRDDEDDDKATGFNFHVSSELLSLVRYPALLKLKSFIQ